MAIGVSFHWARKKKKNIVCSGSTSDYGELSARPIISQLESPNIRRSTFPDCITFCGSLDFEALIQWKGRSGGLLLQISWQWARCFHILLLELKRQRRDLAKIWDCLDGYVLFEPEEFSLDLDNATRTQTDGCNEWAICRRKTLVCWVSWPDQTSSSEYNAYHHTIELIVGPNPGMALSILSNSFRRHAKWTKE